MGCQSFNSCSTSQIRYIRHTGDTVQIGFVDRSMGEDWWTDKQTLFEPLARAAALGHEITIHSDNCPNGPPAKIEQFTYIAQS